MENEHNQNLIDDKSQTKISFIQKIYEHMEGLGKPIAFEKLTLRNIIPFIIIFSVIFIILLTTAFYCDDSKYNFSSIHFMYKTDLFILYNYEAKRPFRKNGKVITQIRTRAETDDSIFVACNGTLFYNKKIISNYSASSKIPLKGTNLVQLFEQPDIKSNSLQIVCTFSGSISLYEGSSSYQTIYPTSDVLYKLSVKTILSFLTTLITLYCSVGIAVSSLLPKMKLLSYLLVLFSTFLIKIKTNNSNMIPNFVISALNYLSILSICAFKYLWALGLELVYKKKEFRWKWSLISTSLYIFSSITIYVSYFVKDIESYVKILKMVLILLQVLHNSFLAIKLISHIDKNDRNIAAERLVLVLAIISWISFILGFLASNDTFGEEKCVTFLFRYVVDTLIAVFVFVLFRVYTKID